MSGDPLRAATIRSGCCSSMTARAYVPVTLDSASRTAASRVAALDRATRWAMTSVSVSEVKATPLALGRRIVDDAVVDDADPAVLAGVRVRVLLGRRAVGGPARMSDAHLAGEPLGQGCLQIADAADLAEYLSAAGAQDGDPR